MLHRAITTRCDRGLVPPRFNHRRPFSVSIRSSSDGRIQTRNSSKHDDNQELARVPLADTLLTEELAQDIKKDLSNITSIQEAEQKLTSRLRGVHLTMDNFNWLFSNLYQPEAENPEAFYNLIAVFNLAKKAKVPLDESAYWFAMHAYNSIDEPPETEKLFKEMQTNGILPESPTYFALIDSYAQQDRVSDMLNSFEEAKAKGITPDRAIFNTILYTLARIGQSEEMMRRFQEMKSTIGCDDFTYYFVIDGLKDQGQQEEALAIWNDLKNEERPDLPGMVKNGVPLECLVLEVMSQLDRKEDMKDLFRSMISQDIEPDEEAYKAMEKVFDKNTEKKDYDRLISEMRQKGYK
eukprot:TRINITY_DN3702_c2_g1_i1.p1 TRINITY_DN3702_c2_g1~~TRINITY_DN3702_c2_g1_i1.p1  ORF type:complete len:351 (-),score=69.13 TRINITY_DN3702_c2_g1_i1:40-1092(-)